ncbi:MAG: hypothetical protein KAW00_00300 [Dehalococcoidia bacterium]|nr:hypothetical protein [Dehalococcoidia bacterium]
MEEKIKERNELLKSVYEQHWLHARHVENERLWFTNIYVVATGVLLAYTFGRNGSAFWPWPILVPVFILSVAGFLMCHSMRIPFCFHSRAADIIQIKEWQLPYHYCYSKAPEPPKSANSQLSKYFSTASSKEPSKFGSFSEVLHLLYSTMSSFALAFLLHDLAHSSNWAWYEWWIALIVGFVCFGILYGYFYSFIFKNKENEVKKYFDALLENT